MTKLVNFINKRFDSGRYFLRRDLAAQLQQLLIQRDLDRTNVGTRSAQAAGVGQRMVGLGVLSRIEHRADRAGNGGVVAVAAATPIDRAGVHAGTAADAAQRFAISLVGTQSNCARCRPAPRAVRRREAGRENARCTS